MQNYNPYTHLSRRTVRDRLQQLTGSLNVQRISLDFEQAVWQACRSVFPSCRLHGCFFHWCQSVWRKVQEIGLQSEYSNDPTAKRVIRHLFGLPFLPHALIPRTFRLLCYDANTSKLRSLFRYVQRTWIRQTVSHNNLNMWRPFHWSVFGRDMRTNNSLEGWHNRLNRKALKAKLPFYALVKLLYEESQVTKIYKGFFSVGKLPLYRKRRYVRLNNRIRHFWSLFRARRITPLDLVRRCAWTYCPNL